MRLRNAFRLGVYVLALAAYAQTMPKGVQKITSVEGITEYRLDNGLTVLLFPDPTKQTATVNVTYLVGSRHENYGETGMAHLLEHLLFLGSTNHPKPLEEFRQHGARWNGSTWFDRTNYFETFPAEEATLRWALSLEADRMVNCFVSKEALDKEMTVVRNEFEMGENSPGRVLNQRTMAAAYLWHNYGKSTIGAKSDLENVPIDRLKAFYQKHYQPDNAVLTIAGKIDEAKTLAMVAESFGKIPRPTRKLEKTYTLDPVQDGERTITVKRVGDIQALNVMYHIPDAAHADSAAISALAHVLATGPSSRLHRALVETKKATSTGGGSMSLREPGVLTFGAQVRKDGDLKDVEATLLRVVHDVVKEPPSKEEVDRAKQAYLTSIDRMLADSDRVGLLLSEPAASGDWRLIFWERDQIKKVTPEDVLRVAKTYLKEDNRTIGRFIPVEKPDRAEIPPPTDVAAVLKGFKGTATVAAGEVFEATPQNIEKRAVRTSLPNGLKLVLVPKKTRANSVNATLTLRFGNIDSLRGQRHQATFAANMLMRGTSKRTRQQLRDEFDKLKARVNISGGAGLVTAMIETDRQNLPQVMALVAEILREPAFPEPEFEQLRQQMLASAEASRREPQTVAVTAISQHMNPYAKDDIRYTPTPEETVEGSKAVTLDAVKNFYQNYYGASNGELVVVGDHDSAEMQALAAKLFGDWKSPKPYAIVPWPYNPVQALNKSFETPDKSNAFFIAALPLKLSDHHADYPALMLANYIFGGGSGNRLFARIRTKEGLSYGVNSGLTARHSEESGTFQVFAISNPQNTAKVESTLKEEFAKALKEGFSAEEVDAAKKGWAQSRLVSRSSDQSLAMQLAQLAYQGRTMAFAAELDQKIAALTPEQVNGAFRKYITADQISFVKAGDFAKGASETK